MIISQTHTHTIIIVGHFNPTISVIDRMNTKKTNKDIKGLDNNINSFEQIDIYSVPHPQTEECMFFSRVYTTFSKTNHE